MSCPSHSLAAIIIMGVCGSGKSLIGERLADHLGWSFRDGDSFHPAQNIARMQAGIPLQDADRMPWLEAIARWIDENRAAGMPVVIACSALKRMYRDVLRNNHADLCFVHLDGSRELIASRLALRKGHFMPAGLLDSQLATLEPPAADEAALLVSIDQTPDRIVGEIVARSGLQGAHSEYTRLT